MDGFLFYPLPRHETLPPLHTPRLPAETWLHPSVRDMKDFHKKKYEKKIIAVLENLTFVHSPSYRLLSSCLIELYLLVQLPVVE